jgi:hypothetical protein
MVMTRLRVSARHTPTASVPYQGAATTPLHEKLKWCKIITVKLEGLL